MQQDNQMRWIGIVPANQDVAIPCNTRYVDSTDILKNGVAINGVTVIHTVSNNKTFYLQDFVGFVYNAAGATIVTLYTRDTSDVLAVNLLNISPAVAYNIYISHRYGDYAVIPEGYDICIATTSSTSQIDITIHGNEK